MTTELPNTECRGWMAKACFMVGLGAGFLLGVMIGHWLGHWILDKTDVTPAIVISDISHSPVISEA